MKPGFRLIEAELEKRPPAAAAPTFLVRIEPWCRVFLRNLRDLIWPQRESAVSLLASPPGVFWNDVFVKSRLPWGRFVESAIFHTAAVVVLWSSAQLWPQRPRLATPIAFHSSDVISYEPSEYLPLLDTGSSAAPLQKGDPVYAPQPIISVPPQSDNHQQTIVTPPNLKLDRDVPLPNIVAWAHEAPMVPPSATAARPSEMRLPTLSATVVAPPPDVSRSRIDAAPVLPTAVVAPAPEITDVNAKREFAVTQPAVIAPPPGVEIASMRQLSDINIGHAHVVAPAPQLPMDEQHAISSLARAPLGNATAAVVPPPPSVPAASTSGQQGRLIALSVRPVPPPAQVEAPSGNRRGTFAATPEGKPGNAGTPEGPSNANSAASATNSAGKTLSGVPSGLFVGPGSRTQLSSQISGPAAGGDPAKPADPPLMASASPSRTLATEMATEQQSEAERKIFGVRKSYSMTLNVPNLNSAGGSLVMHFSELKQGEKQGDLFAPVVTRAVAPGYPLELMRENVQGIVELSAVIQSDGSVGDVRVLNSADDRLEAYARNALLRWQFLPALRNGNPVALLAVVRIPFKARALRF